MDFKGAPSKHLGPEAVISQKWSVFHPSATVRSVVPNGHDKNTRIHLQLTDQGVERCNKGNFKRVVKGRVVRVSGPNAGLLGDNVVERFEGKELYVAAMGVRVETRKPGGQLSFFPPPAPAQPAPAPAVPQQVQNEEDVDGKNEDNLVNLDGANLAREEVEGANVMDEDDDRKALPENEPDWNQRINRPDGVTTFAAEVDNGPHIDPRTAPNFSWRLITDSPPTTALECFEYFLPKNYLQNVIIPETNKRLTNQLTLAEFYVWYGMATAMSRFQQSVDSYFGSSGNGNICEPKPLQFPPKALSGNRFKEIMRNLQFCVGNNNNDPFHPYRSWADAFNEHMEKVYYPSFLCCIDESMVKWLNDNVPGWRKVERKPIPMGFEWHTAGDCQSRILFRVRMVEGKYQVTPNANQQFGHYGPTSAVIMQMTRPYANKGRIWILDSGFCVVDGLLGMKQMGNYAIMCAKKRGANWPRGVNGGAILQLLSNNPQGTKVVQRLTAPLDPNNPGVVGEARVLAFKGIEHTSLFLTTCSTNMDSTRCLTRFNQQIDVNNYYPVVADLYYKGRPALDHHNQIRNGTNKSLEEAFSTQDHNFKQSMFIFSVVETNALLYYNHSRKLRGESQVTLDEFRCRLSSQLITNAAWMEQLADRKVQVTNPRVVDMTRRRNTHEFRTRPVKTGTWNQVEKKFLDVKNRYQKLNCRGRRCKKQVRTYCKCNHQSYCSTCYQQHLLS